MYRRIIKYNVGLTLHGIVQIIGPIIYPIIEAQGKQKFQLERVVVQFIRCFSLTFLGLNENFHALFSALLVVISYRKLCFRWRIYPFTNDTYLRKDNFFCSKELLCYKIDSFKHRDSICQNGSFIFTIRVYN